MTNVEQAPPATSADDLPLDLELADLYAKFSAAGLTPLWTQREGLMPFTPQSPGVPAMWRWSTLYPLAEQAGRLVPVGRGGERRAIALTNPGYPGDPYATRTLWAAIQYLGPRETAPAHRHTQTAFRFVVDGEGVWTNVEGDAVAMRRGDLLLTPSWHFHEHHNTSDRPMAWIDGSTSRSSTSSTPASSNSARISWPRPRRRTARSTSGSGATPDSSPPRPPARAVRPPPRARRR
jgi:gentisate 1,2-dioxygenase